MDAVVTLGAYPDEKLHGKVVTISEFPLPTYNIYMAHMKEYAVSVEIATTLANLRPGMSAEVKVMVESLDLPEPTAASEAEPIVGAE